MVRIRKLICNLQPDIIGITEALLEKSDQIHPENDVLQGYNQFINPQNTD